VDTDDVNNVHLVLDQRA